MPVILATRLSFPADTLPGTVGEIEMSGSFLSFALPDVGDAEIEQIREALESGWVTTGPKTHRFETEFAAAVGARHAVAVSSCNTATKRSLRFTLWREFNA